MKEQLICVVKGKEHFKIASPVFTQSMYVGVVDSLRDFDSPLDFFRIEKEKYPLSLQVGFVNAILEAGDCLYVPAFYYIQSKTLTDD